MSKQWYVYILTNKSNRVLYIGVTSNISERIWQHKQKIAKGFTSTYNVDKLVYLEVFETIQAAIAREKQLKGGSRKKKIELIQRSNSTWRDLSQDIL